jgi:hypothetical protein
VRALLGARVIKDGSAGPIALGGNSVEILMPWRRSLAGKEEQIWGRQVQRQPPPMQQQCNNDQETRIGASGPLFFRWLQGHAPLKRSFAEQIFQHVVPTLPPSRAGPGLASLAFAVALAVALSCHSERRVRALLGARAIKRRIPHSFRLFRSGRIAPCPSPLPLAVGVYRCAAVWGLVQFDR